MDKLWTLVGGVVGGWALSKADLAGTFLSGLEPVVDTVGMLAIVVFSVGLIYKGVQSLIGK